MTEAHVKHVGVKLQLSDISDFPSDEGETKKDLEKHSEDKKTSSAAASSSSSSSDSDEEKLVIDIPTRKTPRQRQSRPRRRCRGHQTVHKKPIKRARKISTTSEEEEGELKEKEENKEKTEKNSDGSVECCPEVKIQHNDCPPHVEMCASAEKTLFVKIFSQRSYKIYPKDEVRVFFEGVSVPNNCALHLSLCEDLQCKNIRTEPQTITGKSFENGFSKKFFNVGKEVVILNNERPLLTGFVTTIQPVVVTHHYKYSEEMAEKMGILGNVVPFKKRHSEREDLGSSKSGKERNQNHDAARDVCEQAEGNYDRYYTAHWTPRHSGRMRRDNFYGRPLPPPPAYHKFPQWR